MKIYRPHISGFPWSRFLLALLFVIGLADSLSGVDGEETDRITSIRIEHEGFRNVSEQYIRSNIQVREGDEYRESAVDHSIRTLYRTGLFDFIHARFARVNGEGILTFTVRPKYRVSEIELIGNERISDRRLRRELETDEGDFVDEFNIKADADALRSYYLRRGHSDVSIDYIIDRDDDTGRARVQFHIDEGTRIRIRSIQFEGNDSISDRRLRRQLELKRWNPFISWLTGSGRFEREILLDDIDSLLGFYRDEGFLDVEIRESEVEMSYPRENRLVVTFTIDEGRRYETGELSISGNTLFGEEELMGVLRLRTGDIFSPSKVERDRRELRNFYGSRGYLETNIRADRRPNLETGRIDLEYRISESDRFHLESIRIQGNTKTKSNVILRELALAPGEIFDLVRMENSQIRLENTRFFENVALSPETIDIPNRKDLRIVVQEGRTGNLSLGAGFSSLERVVVFAELTQGNFDLFNWRSFFQGAGQKFRIRLQLGTRSNEIIIAFEEPWLFQRRLAFGFEAFRRETRFASALFNELRTGFEVYLRRRLFELVEGRLSYRLELVDIFDIDRFASQQIRDEAGERLVSKVGFSLTRDTRDRLVLTRRGNRVQLDNFVAGGPFGGDVDYWQPQLRASQFIPTFEALSQTLAFFGRTGTIVPYGDSDRVPFFDRSFLGGPGTMRGFRFRDVGPKDEFGEPIGGNAFGYLSAEYGFLLADPLQFVVFYDWGFVNDSDWNFTTANYNDNWGLGLRIFILGAPLRLDFGFPLTSDEFNDRGMQFNFSFGTRF